MLSFFKKKSTGLVVVAASADGEFLGQVVKWVEREGHEVVGAESGGKALAALRSHNADLFLVDHALPDIPGIDVCARLHENESTAYIPVILMRGADDTLVHSRIVAAGVDDVLMKPVDKKALLAKVETGLKWHARWKAISAAGSEQHPETDDFREFKKFLGEKLALDDFARAQLSTASPAALYSVGSRLSVGSHRTAELMAEFLELPYSDRFAPEDVVLGALPIHLCRAYSILAVRVPEGVAIPHSNPFLPRFAEVRDLIRQKHPDGKFVVSDPNIIALLFQGPEYEEAF